MAKPKIPKEYQDFIYEFMKSMQEETSALPTMRAPEGYRRDLPLPVG